MELTYSYIFNLTELPEFLLFFLWLQITIVILSAQCLFGLCSDQFEKIRSCFECITDNVIEPAIGFVFNMMLKSRENKVYTILSYKVPDFYKFNLFAIVLNLIGVAMVQFWDKFLFEESRGCSIDQQLICFPSFPNLTTPRLNCSDTSFLEDNNITSVICYQMVYNIGSATGSAIGVVTTTALIIYLFTFIFLKTSQGKDGSIRRQVITLIIQIIIALVIVIAIFFLSKLQYPADSTRAKQKTAVFTNISIGYTVAYGCVLIPWQKFEKYKKNGYSELQSSTQHQ